MNQSLQHIADSLGKGGTQLVALFLMGVPVWHVAGKVRRWAARRRQRLLPAALLLSVGAHAQGFPAGAATVQNYDTTTVSWTLPAGMSHKVARQAALTLTKMGTTQDKTRLTTADSAFLYKWMPGVLEPPKRRR
ncbi:hypothetical protein [Hymenobacter sp. DG01]|uniref:hypothetical protein n=1 Tax=Hymenobacter sp. DG01 TaxID=2584940 RepID=UPI001123B2C5|nr:hypothetical protein [Hymenobacter sp. DG01]